MAIYPRHVESRVREALHDTRVVAITGPRQAGKTTLARRFATRNRIYITLDDQAALAAARSDPTAFIRGLNSAVIDEVQRAPEILLAIKRRVDEDNRPGRYLLTGSADLATLATARESLAGRIESIPLYPLSRSELLQRRPSAFISKAFQGTVPPPAGIPEDDELLNLASRGGYPEAIARSTERRRQDWYREYVASIIKRDLPEVASISRPDAIAGLMQLAAGHAGQLINFSEFGRSIGLDHKTVARYMQALEQLYLVRRLQPWMTNELSRLVKTPKLQFIDAGLLCALRGHSVARLRADRTLLGPVLECLVYSELLKTSEWSTERTTLYHYRDKDQREVDIVLENDAGQIVGIEVKASASISRKDFTGLDRLATIAGPRFVQGILLYAGDQVLSFAEHLRAAPLSCLWA